MERARLAVLELLRYRETFKNKDLAQVLQVSPQRCAVLLKQLVDIGEVERVGQYSGARYRIGRGNAILGDRGVARGADAKSLWDRLAESLVGFVYVRPSRLGLRKLRTKTQLLTMLDGDYRRQIVVLDLSDIQSISWVCAEFLAAGGTGGTWNVRLEIINANDSVRTLLELARRKLTKQQASMLDPAWPLLPVPGTNLEEELRLEAESQGDSVGDP